MLRKLSSATVVVATAAMLGGLALTANAGDGVQLTPDQKTELVSKDIKEQRWAISLDFERGTVTGNVYQGADAEPAFVYCTVTEVREGSDPTKDVYVLDCSGSNRCPTLPCGESWDKIGTVEVPGSFFLP